MIEFLHRVLAVFHDYFGEFDEHSIKDNFSTVYQVFALVLSFIQSDSGVEIAAGRNVGQWLSFDNGTERAEGYGCTSFDCQPHCGHDVGA